MMRIILVDDEPVILEEMKMILENNDSIEVVAAYTDPLEAFQELAATRPECAFLDIEMAGLSGIELAEKLSSINPAIEVVFVTAYNHYAAQAFEVNAIDYILKPIRPERVNKAIDKLIMNWKNKPEFHDASCRIRCFGSFEVVMGNHSIKWSRSKTKEILAYLLQHEGKWVTKYKLIDQLWPEYEPKQGLANLQTSVWALRKSLKEAGCNQIVIEFDSGRYTVKLNNVDWDLRQFEKLYEIYKKSGSQEVAQKLIQCYRGEYLEGEDWSWADLQREGYIIICDKLVNES